MKRLAFVWRVQRRQLRIAPNESTYNLLAKSHDPPAFVTRDFGRPDSGRGPPARRSRPSPREVEIRPSGAEYWAVVVSIV